jgi:diguanylate cyclase (GGDEF)-like protein
MTHLLKSVADLTSRDDRDELELALASVTAKLLSASKLRLWRIASYSGELRLREHVNLKNNRTIAPAPQPEICDLPLLDSHPDLRACYDSNAPVRLKRSRPGQNGHVFPITSTRGVVGFLEVHHPEALAEDQREMLSGLLSIYQNHLKILDYSEYDELTGLLNRKTFNGALAQFLRPGKAGSFRSLPFARHDARREANADQHVWLAVLDIDFFKRINDRFGHLYGDEVLILLARLMHASFREQDRLFRCGGEEFVVILAPTEAEFAEGVLERFRDAVESFDFPQVGRVTVSIGFTRVMPGDNPLTAFGRADEALYIAKEQGRNRVLGYESLVAGGVLHDKTSEAADVEMF